MKYHKCWVSSACRLCDYAVNVKGIRVLHSLIWHWPCCTVKQMTRGLCEPVLITGTRQNKACSAQLYVHTIVTSVQSRQSLKTSVQALTRHAETLHLQDVKSGQFWYIVQLYGLNFFHLTDTVTMQIHRFELHWPQYCILSPDVQTASWWQTQFHSQWFSEINKWDWKHLNVRLYYSCTCVYFLEHDVTQSEHQCTSHHMFGFSSFMLLE